MHHATFCFHAELNDFLVPGFFAPGRDQRVSHSFQLRASIKDIIESIGVPHTEVDALTVNGAPADFSYVVQGGDAIDVYPAFAAPDDVPSLRLPLVDFRFVLDTHLGRLATYLRILGFDTVWQRDCDDATLARASSREQRILLTRDRGLLKRNEVVYGYFVRATAPRDQWREVVRRFRIACRLYPFTRCLRCNVPLERVAKDAIMHRLQPLTAQHYNEFRRCPSCDRVYWEGSHYQHMLEQIDALLRREP